MGQATRRYLLLAVLLALAVTAALAWPARAWKGDEGVLGLGLAGLICLLGAAAGRGIGALLTGLDATGERAPQATQAAVGVRLVLTLALSTPVFVLQPIETRPFAVWLAAHYLAQLALELFVSLRELGQNRGPTGTPARPSSQEAVPPAGSSMERAGEAEGAADR